MSYGLSITIAALVGIPYNPFLKHLRKKHA
jgi:hypothetical protein